MKREATSDNEENLGDEMNRSGGDGSDAKEKPPAEAEPTTAAVRRRVTLFKRPGRRGKEDEEDPERKRREAAKQAELDAKYKSWSRGVAQIKEVCFLYKTERNFDFP